MAAMRDSDSDGEPPEADLRSRLAAVDIGKVWWHRDKLASVVGADADAIKRAFRKKDNIDNKIFRYGYQRKRGEPRVYCYTSLPLEYRTTARSSRRGLKPYTPPPVPYAHEIEGVEVWTPPADLTRPPPPSTPGQSERASPPAKRYAASESGGSSDEEDEDLGPPPPSRLSYGARMGNLRACIGRLETAVALEKQRADEAERKNAAMPKQDRLVGRLLAATRRVEALEEEAKTKDVQLDDLRAANRRLVRENSALRDKANQTTRKPRDFTSSELRTVRLSGSGGDEQQRVNRALELRRKALVDALERNFASSYRGQALAHLVASKDAYIEGTLEHPKIATRIRAGITKAARARRRFNRHARRFMWRHRRSSMLVETAK